MLDLGVVLFFFSHHRTENLILFVFMTIPVYDPFFPNQVG